MLRPPQRVSLAAQTLASLREYLADCSEGERLPSERELCAELGVSRMTLRLALAKLRAEGTLAGGRGQPPRLCVGGKKAPRTLANRTVAVLSPRALLELDPRVLFWVDELREALAKEGFKLDFIHQRNCYTARPERALEELASRLRPATWLLYLSSEPIQKWFSARGLPAIISGSRYEAVGLTSVDVDYRAACRHAAGRFLAKGHRCLALLNPRTVAAGDLESELGFTEAAATVADAQVLVTKHDGSVSGLCSALSDRLLQRPRRPTAFLVSRPAHALTALGHLVWRGLRMPKEAALIARDHDSFLEYVMPSMARYYVDPVVFAHKLSRAVLSVACGTTSSPVDHRIMPRLLAGQTLG